MFDFLWSLVHPLHDPQVGAVGDPHNHCAAAEEHAGCRLDMYHQGMIPVAKSNLFQGQNLKLLKITQFKGHTRPEIVMSMGPSVTKLGDESRIFSFTARVEPGTALADGVRVDWSAPPDGARVLVSPDDSGKLHEVTGWISTKADGQIPGGIPQSQNIVFSQPEQVKRIEIQMRDAPSSVKTQFGIDQVVLVTNPRDMVTQ